MYTDKNTQEEMYRIVIAYNQNNNKYYGLIPANVFLNKEDVYENNIKNAIDSKKEVEYETEENISTGKTKVIGFNF